MNWFIELLKKKWDKGYEDMLGDEIPDDGYISGVEPSSSIEPPKKYTNTMLIKTVHGDYQWWYPDWDWDIKTPKLEGWKSFIKWYHSRLDSDVFVHHYNDDRECQSFRRQDIMSYKISVKEVK